MGAFSSCDSTLLHPHEENTPGFRVSDIPPVLNLVQVLHTIEITTPERHKVAASGAYLRFVALAVHAQRARIRISLRRVVTVQARRAVAGTFNTSAGINNRL